MTTGKPIGAAKRGRGGARAGAGRPPVDAPVRVTVYLSQGQAATAKALGAGNTTAGIREALDRAGPLLPAAE